ncbi:hypothetical protein H2200_005634 [Cladophialophora chaetospira]|uniref:Heavy metal tolerance protein n=1 Tax=Cladophialophora chaetospira TaxID=386627 RepID=A0AA38XCH6_9EURO|nr:hypothetical protein H2200_005634 [Cladophialophora chaetospira]
MVSHAVSKPSLTLRVFQILNVVLPALFFAVAGIAVSFYPKRPSRAGDGKLRKAQLSLTLFAAILSCAEAIIELRGSDISKTWHPDAVHALFLTLVYVILSIGLVDNTTTASYPHYGAWAILLVCQGTVFALQFPRTSTKHALSIAHGTIPALQLLVIFVLFFGSLSVQYLQRNETQIAGEETQPLLASEISANGSAKGREAKNPEEEDDEAERLRIRNRPFWEYMASFKIFVPYMYPQSRRLRLYFVGMCICNALTRVATIAYPLSLGAVVNGLGASVPWRGIAIFVLLKFLTSNAGLPLIESWLSYRLTVDLGISLLRHCYNHIMNLSADFHDNKRSSIIWQTMFQGEDVVHLMHDMLFQTLPQLVDLVSAVVVLTYMFGPYMTFIVATTATLFYWLSLKALVTKRTFRRSWLDSYYEQHYQMTESISNWSTVSYFGRIPYEIRRYHDKGEISRDKVLTWWSWECWNRGLRNLIPCLTFMTACICAAVQIAHQQLKVGDFVTLILYWAQLTGPLSSIAGELSRIVDKIVNAEKLVALLEKTPRVQDSPNARPFTFLEGAVEFENVSFAYDSKRQVTKGITFRAAPGKTIALVGQTGGGKSTIFRLLFRFYDVDQGRILVDGQDIRQVNMESFRKHIAMVPQSPVVFNMSILENIRYPDIDCTDEEAIEACKAAALHDKIMSFTKGYQEMVGERGTKLSGGELQRLAIARAILKKANILLLDEATSSIDSVTEKKIQASIRQLCAGKTAFVIAHRLSTILHADHILVIRDGQVVETGTHESLIKQDGAYNELWRSQIRVQADERSRSRSRAAREIEGQVLVNDLNSSAEETQTLVKSLSRSSKNENVTEHSTKNETSGISVDEPAEDSRGRIISKRIAKALRSRVSPSKSTKKDRSSDSGLNPDAPTFRLSWSKSPEKDRSSESVLNPGVRTFRPRRFQDGNSSAVFSEEGDNVPGNYLGSAAGNGTKQTGPSTLENNENDSTISAGKTIFPLKRKWTRHGHESLDTSEDLVPAGEEVIARASGDAPVGESEDTVQEIERYHIRTIPGNIRRRQTASEPFLENATEEDESDDSAREANMTHSARYSRLPQVSRGRAVSAVERKAVQGQMSGERTPYEDELRVPVNTAATTPGVLTPKSNGTCNDTSPQGSI